MLSSYCFPNPNIESTQFASLQLISKNIRLLDKIKPAYCFISQLYLDNNALITLNGIQQFQNLQILSINFNQITTFSQLYKISNKFFLKQLSFIGNPFEADLRNNKEYLKKNIFTNLCKLNQIESKVWNSGGSFRYQNKKFTNKQIYITQSSQDNKTQRYQRKELEFIQTRRQIINNKTLMSNHKWNNQYTITHNKAHVDKLINSHKKNMVNISTTLNKRSRQQSPYFYSHSKEASLRNNKQIQNEQEQEYEYEQIKIKPFETLDEVKNKKDIKNEGTNKNRMEELHEQEQIQQQSQIKSKKYKQYSISLFNSPEQNKPQSNQNQQQSKLIQQKDIKKLHFRNNYRNLAMQFLQQQKNLIAEAFHIRYAKQKVFGILSQQKFSDNQQNIKLKRKAWAVIKIFSSIKKLYDLKLAR